MEKLSQWGQKKIRLPEMGKQICLFDIKLVSKEN